MGANCTKKQLNYTLFILIKRNRKWLTWNNFDYGKFANNKQNSNETLLLQSFKLDYINHSAEFVLTGNLPRLKLTSIMLVYSDYEDCIQLRNLHK